MASMAPLASLFSSATTTEASWSLLHHHLHFLPSSASTGLRPFMRERTRWPAGVPARMKLNSTTSSRGFTAFAADTGRVEEDIRKSNQQKSVELYGKIERVFADSARQAGGGGGGGSDGGGAGEWKEVEGAWVLRPKRGEAAPSVIVHFIGGAFVGASPQLTYRLFLEVLCSRGVLVIATPFASGFDHLRIADEAQFKFDRCFRSLEDPYLQALPVYGIGHSQGSLTHLLIGARYAVQREGNILMSFNNKEATKAIPLFSPVIVPMAQNLGPLFTQVMTNPTFRFGADFAARQLRELSPPLLRQVLPLVEQLPPLYKDLADGKDEFTPSPEETRRLIKSYYGVRKNLLLRFRDDTIDETPELAQVLGSESAVSDSLDMTVRTLPGDHARPLQQVVPEIPPNIADAVTQGGAFIASFAAGTPLADFAKGVEQSLGPSGNTQQLRKAAMDDVGALVDEVAQWIGLTKSSNSIQYLPPP